MKVKLAFGKVFNKKRYMWIVKYSSSFRSYLSKSGYLNSPTEFFIADLLPTAILDQEFGQGSSRPGKDQKRLISSFLKCDCSSDEGTILGRSILHLPRDSNPDIPDVFVHLIRYLKNQKILSRENLFKTPSDIDHLKLLGWVLNQKKYSVIKSSGDPYMIANFLRLLLSEMAEPLCSPQLYSEFKYLPIDVDFETIIELFR